MVESVDTEDLKSFALRRGGSSPSISIKIMKENNISIASNLSEYAQTLLEDIDWKRLTSVNNNWSEDPQFKNYHKLSNKQKGVVGEAFIKGYLSRYGHDVKKSENSDHDLIVDGYKVEIKFSLAVSSGGTIKPNNWIMNHVAKSKDWDRLMFIGVNPENNLSHIKAERFNIYWMAKEDFLNYMTSTPYKKNVFRHQQSGAKAENDDYICSSKKLLEWISLDFVKTLGEW